MLAGATLLSHLLIVTVIPGLALGVWLGAPKEARVRSLALLAAGGIAGGLVFVAVAGLNPFLHPVYGKGGPLTILELPRAVDIVRWVAYTLYQYPLGVVLALVGI